MIHLSPLPEDFFKPRSVAILGASQRGLGLAATMNLTSHGFGGAVYPINPRYEEIYGQRCYPHLGALPEVPELVYILLERAKAIEAVSDAVDRGVRGFVMTSGGFRESGAEGIAAEEALRTLLTAHDARLVGPNCEGFWNVPDATLVTFGSAARQTLPKVRAPIAIVSQSGSIAGGVARRLQDDGVGCDYVVSTGNELNVDAVDVLEWLLEHTAVRVVGLFVEALRDGGRLIALAHRANIEGRSVVVLASGQSDAGRKATQTHTGKMASSARVYQGAFRQAGVVIADTVREFDLILRTLAFCPRSQSKGPAITAISGGSRALIADALHKRGIPLPAFAPETTKRLKEFVPDLVGTENPMDLTGSVLTSPELTTNVVSTLVSDRETDSTVVQFANRGSTRVRSYWTELVAAARSKTIVLSLLSSRLTPHEEADLFRRGLPVVNDPHDVAVVLAALARPTIEPTRPARRARSGPSREPGSLRELVALLAEHGIPFPQTRTASDDLDAADLKFPVVAKLDPLRVAHKTELHGVTTGISDRVALRRVIERLQGLSQAPVVVQEQIGGVEALIAVRQDPDFGPVLAVGLGGVATEVFEEVSFRVLPVPAAEIRRMIAETHLGRVLSGIRGRPPANLEGLVDLAQRVQALYLDLPGLEEIEFNPVMVPAGEEVAVPVDVVMQFAQSEGEG